MTTTDLLDAALTSRSKCANCKEPVVQWVDSQDAGWTHYRGEMPRLDPRERRDCYPSPSDRHQSQHLCLVCHEPAKFIIVVAPRYTEDRCELHLGCLCLGVIAHP